MLEWQQNLVNPALYEPSWVSYMHLIAMACFFLAGWTVAVIERFTWFSRVFLIFCMASVVWQIGRFGMSSITDDSLRAYFGALGYASSLIVIVGAFHIIVNGMQRHHAYSAVLIVSWMVAALGAPLVLVTPWFFSTVQSFSWGYEPILTPVGYAIPMFAGILAVLVIKELFQTLPDKDVTTAYLRRRRKIVAASLFLIPASTDFLPSIGIIALPFSTPFILLFALAIAGITSRYRWLDVNVDVSAIKLLQRSAEPNFLVDQEGVVQYANRGACELFGLRSERELIGHPLSHWLASHASPSALLLAAQSGRPMSVGSDHFKDGIDYQLTVSYLDERNLSFFVNVHKQSAPVRGQSQLTVGTLHSDYKELIRECQSQLRFHKEPLGVLAVGYRHFHKMTIESGLINSERFQKALVQRAALQFSDCLVFGTIQNVIVVMARASIFRDRRELERRIYRLGDSMIGFQASVSSDLYASTVLNVSFDSIERVVDALYADVFNEGSLSTIKVRELSVEDTVHSEADFSVVRAIEENRFEFFLQPVMNVTSRHIVGYEALLRMREDAGRYIQPDAFLSQLEQGHIALKLEYWAVKEAKRILSEFDRCGQSDLWLSINLSTLDLYVSGIVDMLDDEFSSQPDLMKKLCVEITERSAVREENDQLLRQLQQRGVGVAIDDFGTAHSSLSRLIALPLNKLKIDRSFVRQMSDKKEARSVVKYICQLADDMGLEIIAEGVETESEERMLLEYGVHFIQGFLYSRARPLAFWEAHDFSLTAHSVLATMEMGEHDR